MADLQSIDEARDRLSDELFEVMQTIAAFSDLVPENPPPWLFLLERRLDRLQALTESYMQAVHHCMPRPWPTFNASETPQP